MPKVNVDNLDILYTVAYRNVRYPRLEFRTGDLLVVMPKGKSAKLVVEKHKAWIKQKSVEIKNANQKTTKKSLNFNRTTKDLKNLVATLTRNFSESYNFKINDSYFRLMNSKWASHSKKGNLTINTSLKYLPSKLIGYVIFHEMAHSIERKHNSRFWGIIEKKFKNHQQLEKELMVYWFLMQRVFSGELVN